jgi:3-oxoacyl-[acyl-carrier protein] reductase
MGKLDAKVAIVTGGARGLGRSYARRLASLGAKIVVWDFSLKSFEEFEAERRDMTGDSTVAEIEAAGGSAFGVELDVADRVAVDSMVAGKLSNDGGASNLGCQRRRRPRAPVGYEGKHAR